MDRGGSLMIETDPRSAVHVQESGERVNLQVDFKKISQAEAFTILKVGNADLSGAV
jgi:hypothetical protein